MFFDHPSFRYITIVGAHAGRLGNTYNKHALRIRTEMGNYQVDHLRNDLKELQAQYASDSLFRTGLEEKLTYSNQSMRIIIRYFLTTLADFYDSFADGDIALKPKRITVFDLDETTVEHIYPQNPNDKDIIPQLEPHKHKIGNLTVLDPDDNIELGNRPFAEKHIKLSSSILRINRALEDVDEWNEQSLLERQQMLTEMAVKIFSA